MITTFNNNKTGINILYIYIYIYIYIYTKVCLQFAKSMQLNNADTLNKKTINYYTV